jgi:hypothetical protein
MKRLRLVLVLLAFAAIVLVVGSFAWESYFIAQRADYAWNPSIATTAHARGGPVVLFDEGHHNVSTAGLEGRYWPFRRLLEADGYRVRRVRGRFTSKNLQRGAILVIVNASGAGKPQAFGINLPFPSKGDRKDPAFTPEEVRVVRDWVGEGGSLLLIADHAPMGAAAAAMGEAFGVTMRQGFLEVPGELSDPLLYSRENRRLGDHPILQGTTRGDRVDRVMTFTGQSLDGPPESTILLRVPPGAIEYVPEGDSLPARPSGTAQGLAFSHGSGRVVVLGEAAMLTAQVSRREPFGMNSRGNDNERFARNLMRWLARNL